MKIDPTACLVVEAIQEGSLDKLRSVIEENQVDLNNLAITTKVKGVTFEIPTSALLLAIKECPEENLLEVVDYLLKIRTSEGNLLIDINQWDDDGHTFLTLLLNHDNLRLQILLIQLLLDIKDSEGELILDPLADRTSQLLLFRFFSKYVRQEMFELFKKFLDMKKNGKPLINPNEINAEGFTLIDMLTKEKANSASMTHPLLDKCISYVYSLGGKTGRLLSPDESQVAQSRHERNEIELKSRKILRQKEAIYSKAGETVETIKAAEIMVNDESAQNVEILSNLKYSYQSLAQTYPNFQKHKEDSITQFMKFLNDLPEGIEKTYALQCAQFITDPSSQVEGMFLSDALVLIWLGISDEDNAIGTDSLSPEDIKNRQLTLLNHLYIAQYKNDKRKPLCPRGILIKLIETLDGIHKAVNFNPSIDQSLGIITVKMQFLLKDKMASLTPEKKLELANDWEGQAGQEFKNSLTSINDDLFNEFQYLAGKDIKLIDYLKQKISDITNNILELLDPPDISEVKIIKEPSVSVPDETIHPSFIDLSDIILIDPNPIKKAVEKAQSRYHEWYNQKDNVDRGERGFFTWFRHGSHGQEKALKFKSDIQKHDKLHQVQADITNLLIHKSTRFHRHSFASFLLDELVNLKKINTSFWNTEWDHYVLNKETNRYSFSK